MQAYLIAAEIVCSVAAVIRRKDKSSRIPLPHWLVVSHLHFCCSLSKCDGIVNQLCRLAIVYVHFLSLALPLVVIAAEVLQMVSQWTFLETLAKDLLVIESSVDLVIHVLHAGSIEIRSDVCLHVIGVYDQYVFLIGNPHAVAGILAAVGYHAIWNGCQLPIAASNRGNICHDGILGVQIEIAVCQVCPVPVRFVVQFLQTIDIRA